MPKSKLDLSKEKKNHLHDTRLETDGFASIDFFVKENTSRLEFGDMDSYFLAS